MTEKCFKKCVNKPGSVLDTSEQVGFVMGLSFYRFFILLFPEMHCHVYGSIYGLLESCFTSLWSEITTRAIEYVKINDLADFNGICTELSFL